MVGFVLETALNVIWELEEIRNNILHAMDQGIEKDYIRESVHYHLTRFHANQLSSKEANIILPMYKQEYREFTKDNPWRIDE